MKLNTYKNWGFYLLHQGPRRLAPRLSCPPLPLRCKLTFLSDLGLQDTHSQSHRSPPFLLLFQEIL